MDVLCLDLEGVLVPEIWLAVAEHSGIDGLRRTTRDVPVYDELMQLRLGILADHDLPLSAIQDVIDEVEPLPGAPEFLGWARQHYQVAIVSDTFYQFAMPLMAKLGWPTLLCHRLEVEGDRIVGYRLRQEDPKRQSVRAFRSLNYRVLAAGDSYNDLSMLEEADAGFFFRAPEHVRTEFPRFPHAASYEELRALVEASAAGKR